LPFPLVLTDRLPVTAETVSTKILVLGGTRQFWGNKTILKILKTGVPRTGYEKSRDGTESPRYERYEKYKHGTKNPWYETCKVRKVHQWY